MLRNQIIHTAIALALFGLPSAALAQQQPSGWDHNGRPAQSDRNARDERRDDRRTDRNDRNDRDDRYDRNDRHDRDNRGDHRDRDDRHGADRSNDGRWSGNGAASDRYGNNGNYGNSGRDNRSGRLSGEVSSFGGYDLTLRNGQQVRLHQGTVIEPTGTTLRPGMRLAISGHSNSDGTYEADRISVFGG